MCCERLIVSSVLISFLLGLRLYSSGGNVLYVLCFMCVHACVCVRGCVESGLVLIPVQNVFLAVFYSPTVVRIVEVGYGVHSVFENLSLFCCLLDEAEKVK